MVIVCADDYGISKEINRAILECFHLGIISSASIIVNMPGFEDACNLAHKNDFLRSIGFHLNITEGLPVSRKILKERKFCNANGQFCFKRNKNFFLTQREKVAFAEEIEAQIRRYLNMGLQPTHLASHHHIHNEWHIFKVIKPLIRKYKIRFVRSARCDIAGEAILKRFYKRYFNYMLLRIGLRKTQFFGSIEEFKELKALTKKDFKSFEIIVHPEFGTNGKIIDYDGKEIFPAIKTLTEGLVLNSF